MSNPYQRHPAVDAYLERMPDWQRELAERLRDLIHGVDPEVSETVKRKVRPYFVLDGNVCAILATNDHVNLFLYDGAIVPDPHGILTGGHDNSTARMISFYRGDPIQEQALTEMLRRIVENNRAGGWRAIKSAQASSEHA